jgi:PAS domain S-box-containing protein
MDHDELRFIWDESPIGLARVSRDGNFMAVSPRFAEMVGYSETELLVRTYQQITHPDDLGPDTAEAEHLAANPSLGQYQMVKRYISKDQRVVWVNLFVHAITGPGGEFLHFFVFAAELTPVSIIPSGGSAPKPKTTILGYVRDNPKEAFLVFAALMLLIKGRSIPEIIETLWKK